MFVLSGDDAGPLDSYVHARLVAEEKARLVQRARREAAQQTAQARIAASRAQEDDSTGE